MSEPLVLLKVQVNDEHPRVRLEAIRALSFFQGAQAAQAQEIVLDALLYPDDDYIKYTLRETMDALEDATKTP